MGRRISLTVLAVVFVGVDVFCAGRILRKLSPVLSTEAGDIQGKILKSRSGREFFAYKGIPFAKPPIGGRRFQAPVLADKWDGILDCTRYRAECVQLDFVVTGLSFGREDCLYLNVFVPSFSRNQKPMGHPVMVFIHGGYLHMGGTSTLGPHFFMDHDVIIVTIAYRLGALGFLNTGDGVVQGNMGLKDQNLALKWVQQNIRNFGGDPERVTLFGESAGAGSVHYHMLSPKSAGLFSRAIRQSANAINHPTLHGVGANAHAKKFAAKFSCPLDSSENMAACLRSLDAKTLVSGYSDLMDFPIPQQAKFAVAIENAEDANAFLTEDPLELIKTGKINRVPLLTGMNADEGLLHTALLAANATKLNEAIDDWYVWAPKAYQYPPNRTDISQKIFDFYFAPYVPNYKNRRDRLQNFTNANSDGLFNVPIIQSSRHERKYIPVYNYIYDHRGGFNTGTFVAFSQTKEPIVTAMAKTLQVYLLNRVLGIPVPAEFPGTCHGDEMALQWSNPLFDTFFSDKLDLELSKDLVKLWVDFASEAKPLKFREITMPVASPDGPMPFIRLSHKNPEIILDPLLERYNFWDNIGL